MIKIYNVERELISTTNKYNNMEIQREINQIDKLRFYTDKETGGKIKLEGYIEINEGVFVVKENALSVNYSILAHMDLEEFDEIILELKLERMTLNEMIAELTEGTGWTIIGDSDERKTITIDGLSIIDAIFRCVNLFSYEIRFNNIKKEITIGETIGEDRGIYFHSDLNLRSLNMSSDTYDYATRLIPKGKEGLGIESVNDGVPYVENYTFSNKIITKVWRDERYTIAENLKAAAEARLAEIAKPTSYLECSVADLSSHSDYDFFSYDVGDYIFLIDRDLDIKEKYRIGSIRLFPKSIEDSLVVIENKQRSVNDTIRSQDEKIEEHSEDLTNYDNRLSKIEDILGINPDGDWGDWDDEPGGPGFPGEEPIYYNPTQLVSAVPSLKIGLSSWVDINNRDSVDHNSNRQVVGVLDYFTKNVVYSQNELDRRPTLVNRDGRRWLSFNPDPMTLNRWSGSKEDRPSSSIQQHGEYMLHLNSGHPIKSIFIIYYDRTPEPLNNYTSGSAASYFRTGTSCPLGHPFSNLRQTRSRPCVTIIPIITDHSFVAENQVNGFNFNPPGDSDRLVRPVNRVRERAVAVHRNVKLGESINLANIGMNKENYDDYVASNITADPGGYLSGSGGGRGEFYEMNAFFTGEIAEIILHTRELDANEVATLNEYARMKYSL